MYGCVVLCGLPGAGKTTLAHQLKDASDDGTTVRVFEYDALLPKWQVEASGASDMPTFKKARSDLLNDLRKQTLTLKEAKTARACLLVDDNMYYRSMRHQIYQVCQETGVTYIQVYVDVGLTTALQRNAARPDATRVSENVLKQMCARFEPPLEYDEGKRTWEGHCSLRIDGNVHVSAELLWQQLLESWAKASAVEIEFRRGEALRRQEQLAARAQTEQSYLAQANLQVNKAVSQIMQSAAADRRSSLGQELAKFKRTFLAEVKRKRREADSEIAIQAISEMFRQEWDICTCEQPP